MASWHFYCDETCTAPPHTRVGVGGVLAKADDAREIAGYICAWRENREIGSEIKWSRNTRLRHKHYREFVDRVFREIAGGRLSFSCLFLDMASVDLRTHNRNCLDDLWSKLYYQLVLHRAIPKIRDGESLTVFPDAGQAKFDWGDLRNSLANKLARHRNGQVTVNPIKAVTSHFTQMGQVNDVLLGAVGFHQNGKQNRRLSSHKTGLAAQVSSLAGMPTLREETQFGRLDFSIWNFRFNSAE